MATPQQKLSWSFGTSNWLELISSIHSKDINGTPLCRLDNNTEYTELNTRLEAPDYTDNSDLVRIYLSKTLRAVCPLATICSQMLYVISAADANPPADMHYQKLR